MSTTTTTTTDFHLPPTSGPSLPQLVLAAIPLIVCQFYLAHIAYIRPDESCYADALDDDCSFIALADLMLVELAVCLLLSLVAGYMSLFVPWRHALIREYLAHGTRTVGDVLFDPSEQSCCENGTYGYARYHAAADDNNKNIQIRRRVRIFAHYTRERVTLLSLPDRPHSAQPKPDLETDQAVAQNNESRMIAIRRFVWVILFCCYVALVFIAKVLWDMNQQMQLSDWQPDYDGKKFVVLYLALGFVGIPLVTFLVNRIVWSYHERWMTSQHEVVEDEGEYGL